MKYTDPDGRSIWSSAWKIAKGTVKTLAGTAGIIICGAATGFLVVDDGTGVGVVDDSLIPFVVAGATGSTLLAANGLSDIADGAIEVATDVNAAVTSLFNSAQSVTAAPSPLPPDPDDRPNFKNSKETAKDFKTDTKNFERNIKQDILKDSRTESANNKALNKFLNQNSNPDIGTSKNGDIWLKSRTTGEIIKTGLNVLMYLE